MNNYTLQRISASDRFLFDSRGNLAGIQNPKGGKADLIPANYTVDPDDESFSLDVDGPLTADSINATPIGNITPSTVAATVFTGAGTGLTDLPGDGVDFLQSGTGAVARTMQAKVREFVSVIDFGADATGAASSLTAFTNAYNATSAGGRIQIPPGTYLGVNGVLTGSKFVIWDADGLPSSGITWNLPGLVFEGYTNRQIANVEQTAGDDYARFEYRRITSHTGGTPGNVSSNLRVTTQVGSGVTNFEWGFLSLLNNYATTGENVAVYGQANKKAASTGPTWAGVFEAKNDTSDAEVGGALVGIEVDVFSNGADTNSNRVAVDIVVGKGDAGGATCVALAGVRLGSQNQDITKGWFANGLVISDKNTNSINITALSDKAIRIAAATAVGIDLSESTVSTSAIRIKRGDNIAFEETSAFTMKADASVSVIRVDNAGTERVGFVIGSSGTAGVRINGTTVIGSRNTGWSAFTGTTNKATVYDTSTITLVQLAQRVAEIQAAATTHGLLGA